MLDSAGSSALLLEIATAWNAGATLRQIGRTHDRSGAWVCARLEDARRAGLSVAARPHRCSAPYDDAALRLAAGLANGGASFAEIGARFGRDSVFAERLLVKAKRRRLHLSKLPNGATALGLPE